MGGRGPCPGPCIEDDSGKTIPIEDVVRRTFDACAKRREEDPSLAMLKEAAAADREYTTILEARIRNISKSEIKELPQDNPCRSMVKIWDNIGLLQDESLMTYENTRLVVPKSVRGELIKIAHIPHMGVICTYQSLRVRYFWKQMKADVEEALQGLSLIHI